MGLDLPQPLVDRLFTVLLRPDDRVFRLFALRFHLVGATLAWFMFIIGLAITIFLFATSKFMGLLRRGEQIRWHRNRNVH